MKASSPYFNLFLSINKFLLLKLVLPKIKIFAGVSPPIGKLMNIKKTRYAFYDYRACLTALHLITRVPKIRRFLYFYKFSNKQIADCNTLIVFFRLFPILRNLMFDFNCLRITYSNSMATITFSFYETISVYYITNDFKLRKFDN